MNSDSPLVQEGRIAYTTDAEILGYRALALDELIRKTTDLATRDELARAASAIRHVAGRLRRPTITSAEWERAARKAMTMYDWSKKETVAINDFILTVSDAAARLVSEYAAPISAPSSPEKAAVSLPENSAVGVQEGRNR